MSLSRLPKKSEGTASPLASAAALVASSIGCGLGLGLGLGLLAGRCGRGFGVLATLKWQRKDTQKMGRACLHLRATQLAVLVRVELREDL